MTQLPILQENSFLTLLIKDNFIHANLAYSDLSTHRSYILSDSTDLSPLKFRLDDVVFTRNFWFEYFDSLEKVFNWDIVDKRFEGVFKIKHFEREGIGVGGVKIIVDDNQPFFKNIFLSLRDFSRDISIKVGDDKYMEEICKGLLERLGYSDLIWLDLDISHFSIYRARKEELKAVSKNEQPITKIQFTSSKIDWKNEIGLIDFIKSSKIKAFFSQDTSSSEISDRWANFIAHNCEYIADPLLHDILRAFTTMQILSIKQQNKDKLGDIFGENSAIILTGSIPKLLTIKELLFAVIDGLELDGIFDMYIDNENKLLTFGKNFIEKEKASDIVVFRGDILPSIFKLLIPEISRKNKDKVIFSGKVLAQNQDTREMFAFGSSLQILKIPHVDEKIIIQGELKNGAVFSNLTYTDIEFLSIKNSLEYKYLIVDGRMRPIVYGPSAQENRIKFKVWGDADKE
ncbi:MAG TPA: hypothetical protein PK145_00155 [Candidatus Dojkabacteria bacterium]|nr:hypothetical protein [Candidatus Dojkabacteria bacterium]